MFSCFLFTRWHVFFKSDTFMTKARLKWATKQHPEAELLLFEFCSHFLSYFFIFHIFSHSRASRIQSFFIGNHGAQQYFSAFHGPSPALARPKQHWKHNSWVSQATVRFSWKKVSLMLIRIATLRIWEKLLWFLTNGIACRWRMLKNHSNTPKICLFG